MTLRILRQAAVGIAALGLLTPSTNLSAAEPRAAEAPATMDPLSSAAVPDVALAAGGVFSGQVVDAQGQPQVGLSVMVCQSRQVVATTATDEHGAFSFSGLQGGMYQVVSGQGTVSYRLWAPGTAPPSARQSALLMTGEEVVRAQGGLRRVLTNPWFLSIAVATAIAVPIAVATRDRSSSS
ncbi:MAG TPA: carboxypeptidase-like regulatory domain-containing protein [Pirellulales bacterium]|jgi:hypothetical protein|nr:carboxypeptidase-like regulatory domain-containing protein [Pirellulales bacterium]